MPQGSFNVSRLLQQLGLKNVIEMPVSEQIAPVVALETMIGQVPYHSAPMALAGGQVAAVALEYSAFEVVSLDPGGCLILWIHQPFGTPFRMGIETSGTVAPWSGLGPIAHPAQNFGNTPIQSQVFSGTVAAAPPTTRPTVHFVESSRPALWLPHGSRLLMVNETVNSQSRLTFALMGIAATEAEPD